MAIANRIHAIVDATNLKRIGRGTTKDAYDIPGGDWVLVVMRAQHGTKCLADFVAFCKQNKSNDLLPRFNGKMIKIKTAEGERQGVRMEHLYPVQPEFGSIMAYLTDVAERHITFESFSNYVTKHRVGSRGIRTTPAEGLRVVQKLVAEGELERLYSTLRLLYTEAQSRGYGLDAHRENFMRRANNQIVITDPWLMF